MKLMMYYFSVLLMNSVVINSMEIIHHDKLSKENVLYHPDIVSCITPQLCLVITHKFDTLPIQKLIKNWEFFNDATI